MTTNTNGAEWKRFYSDDAAWPKGAWHDDEVLTIDGKQAGDADPMSFPDTAAVTITGGIVYLKETDQDGPSLEAYFRKWRKAQSTVVFICEAPRELEDAVRAAVKAAGGKVT